jgi:hypothetical protein
VPDANGGDYKIWYAAADVPDHILSELAAHRLQKNFIMALEEMAIAAPYFTPELRQILSGRHVIHFADNQAANGAVIKGYSSAPDIALLISALHVRWAEDRVNVWIEFVKSEANLADDPSRGDFSFLEQIGATRLLFVFSPLPFSGSDNERRGSMAVGD